MRSRCFARLIVINLMFSSCAVALDIFGIDSFMQKDPAPLLLGHRADCGLLENSTESPLQLLAAIHRALCTNPKTRAAWEHVNGAAAVVGQSKAAYLPTLNMSAQYNSEQVRTSVIDDVSLNSSFKQTVNEDTATLQWLLYDFGARAATLANAQHLFELAIATEKADLQTLVAAVSKDWFDAQVAKAQLNSACRIEQATRKILEAATVRVNSGISAITDELQARTSHAQAVYAQAKAESNLRSATGLLAIDINEQPDKTIILPDVEEAPPDLIAIQSARDLLEEAIMSSPKVAAANAQWQAALAEVDSARAQGRPTISLVGEGSYSTAPVSASLGQEEMPARTVDKYIGLKISIPVFEGFTRQYKIRQAQASAAELEADLYDVKQQVSGTVWSNFQLLESNAASYATADELVKNATEAFDATKRRYESGVGNILELLNSQSALGSAEQQRIQAVYDWHNARVQLALSVGTLSLSTLD